MVGLGTTLMSCWDRRVFIVSARALGDISAHRTIASWVWTGCHMLSFQRPVLLIVVPGSHTPLRNRLAGQRPALLDLEDFVMNSTHFVLKETRTSLGEARLGFLSS